MRMEEDGEDCVKQGEGIVFRAIEGRGVVYLVGGRKGGV